MRPVAHRLNGERLEERCTLDGEAPYVVEMVPQTDGTVLVRFSEDIVNLDVGDFRVANRGKAVDLTGASIQSQLPTEFSLLLPRDGPDTDAFIASPNRGTMMGTTYTIDAFGYRRINAYATLGDNTAQLTGSIGNDVFTARPEYSVLSGAGFTLFASGFGTGLNKVMGFGGGGTDIANLYDSAGDDRATIGYQSASLSGTNFNIIATDFDRTQLYASLGNDTARLSDSSRDDKFVGTQSSATLSSLGFVAVLQRFALIELADSQGGVDQVLINSIAYQLRVGLGWRV